MGSLEARIAEIVFVSSGKFTRVLGMSLLAFLVCVPAFPQTYTGRILGMVSDQSGSVVVGATVTITDVQRGTSRTLTTDQAGEYVAPDLPPGMYKLRAEAKGFQSVERPNIELQVAKDVRVDFVLRPGAVSETITVTEAVSIVENTNDVLGGTLSNKEINDLPLNGRDFQNLVVLRPGVQRYPGGGLLSVSSNGNRPEDNNFIVDGVDNNDPYFGYNVINQEGVQGTPATILPIDAIQEFNVEENPTAEYGLKSGAIVNVGLKSGTNTFHGTAYDFERNNAVDARNFFNTKPGPQRPLHLHQFGATVGGPIVKNRLFFFTAYEGVRSLVGNSFEVPSPATVSLATSANPAGNPAISIPDAIAAVQTAGLAVNPLSMKLARLYPANNGTNPLGPGIVATGIPNTNQGNNGLAKIDYQVSQRHVLSGRYFIGDSLQAEEDAPYLRPEWESQTIVRAQVVGINWTWTASNSLVNEARFGFNRLSKAFTTRDGNVNPQTYGINTGVTNPLEFGMPGIIVAGFTQLGGNLGWPLLTTPDQTFQFVDNLSLTRGKHAIKLGGEFRRGTSDNTKQHYAKGRVRFLGGGAFANSTPLEDFFAGVPGDGRIFVGDSRRQVSMWTYGAFIQDDWRASPRFTVNLGLRYELNTVIKEANDLLGNFDPNIGLVQVGQQVSSPYNGDHNNFAPRVSLVWDVTGQGRTVIRAGAGIMYQVPSLADFLGQCCVNNASTIGIQVVPTGALGVTPGGGKIDVGSLNLPGSGLNWTPAGPVFNVSTISCATSPCDTLAVDRNLRNPYVSSWNLNVQHAFTKNVSLQVGYVGNHGTKLYSIYDINQVQNQSSAEIACGHCEAIADRPFGIKFPFLRFINQFGNGDESNYNALQATLTQRASHGLSFILGYTYAHSLDQASDDRITTPMNSINPAAEYGNSDTDIRHRVTFSLTYAIPQKKSFGQLLEGWQLNSIVVLQGAQPWPVIDTGNDVSGTGESNDRWNFFGDPADFTSSPNGPIPFFPGGTASQPGQTLAINNPACVAHASLTSLESYGCYQKGNSVMTPPNFGSFGTMGRNIFRGPAFYNWDLSIVKNWKFRERLTAQLRGEFFNVLNHPNFANPWGPQGTFGLVDPSSPSSFGCACATPDVAGANPVMGTGGSRNIQLGLKFIF